MTCFMTRIVRREVSSFAMRGVHEAISVISADREMVAVVTGRAASADELRA